MAEREDLTIIEHDIENEDIIEKARALDRSRLMHKYFKRSLDKIKEMAKDEVIKANDGVLPDKKEYGMFNMLHQSQRRMDNAKARKICRDLGFDTNMYKSPMSTESIGPSFDDGRLTYVRYSQLVNHIKGESASNDSLKEIEEVFDLVEKPSSDDLKKALSTCWGLTRAYEATIQSEKDELKEMILKYTEEDKGYNPQLNKMRLHMSGNLTFSTIEMEVFSGSKFFKTINEYFLDEEGVSPSEETLKMREHISNYFHETALNNAKASSLDFLVRNCAAEVLKNDSTFFQEAKEAQKEMEDPEEIFDFCIERLPVDVANRLESYVDSKATEDIEKYEDNPVAYLEYSAKSEVSFIKFDPPRGYKSEKAQQKIALEAACSKIPVLLESTVSTARIDDLDYLADRLEQCNRLDKSFNSRAHIYREKDPELDREEIEEKHGPKKMSKGLSSKTELGF